MVSSKILVLVKNKQNLLGCWGSLVFLLSLSTMFYEYILHTILSEPFEYGILIIENRVKIPYVKYKGMQNFIWSLYSCILIEYSIKHAANNYQFINPANFYLFKVRNRNTRKRCEIQS